MMRWRVGARPLALRNSCGVMRSPDAPYKPEKMTPELRSANEASVSVLGVDGYRSMGVEVEVEVDRRCCEAQGSGVCCSVRVNRGRRVWDVLVHCTR
jgi:hypothetical protein